MSKVEKLFTVFDETAQILADECSYTYLEALAETGENLFQQSVLQRHWRRSRPQAFGKI